MSVSTFGRPRPCKSANCVHSKSASLTPRVCRRQQFSSIKRPHCKHFRCPLEERDKPTHNPPLTESLCTRGELARPSTGYGGVRKGVWHPAIDLPTHALIHATTPAVAFSLPTTHRPRDTRVFLHELATLSPLSNHHTTTWVHPVRERRWHGWKRRGGGDDV